jgi:ring-1,2-phenylacetyl-CoA epoxidase subunit PaaD
MDPELPMVSIVDLGMIGAVEVAESTDGGSSGPIRVKLLPTFIGCPAIDVIRQSVAARLERFGCPVAIEVTFNPPWTTDRISAAGRKALTAAGIAEPTAPEDVRCPYCCSARVVMDSAFGPTQCRSLYYCRDCRQPFEAMKLV